MHRSRTRAAYVHDDSPSRAARALAWCLPALLALGACGSGAGDDTEPPTEAETVSDALVPRIDLRQETEAYPYLRGGPYEEVLARCALIDFDNRFEACTLETLPFIVQDTPDPSVEDVLARVLVTHDWMGERFETLLRSRSEELLPLFGSVTSVLIGSTVRPSYYWAVTGAIRLDPEGLWLTVEEKANVSLAEDARASQRALLAFRGYSVFWNDGFIFPPGSLEDEEERSFADIELSAMSLLFHELAHAVDFLPPGAAPLLNPSLQPVDALWEIRDRFLSPSLYERQPLRSDLLFGLAEVRFTPGLEPTDAQRRVSGALAGAEMAPDGATHFYSYNTIREDFANLFETLQMSRLFGVDLHAAFTVQPADAENFGCEELFVEWGVFNRLGDPTVIARARDAVELVYGPDPTLDDFLATLESTERPMTVGLDFCTNLRSLSSDPTPRSRTTDLDALIPGKMTTHAERHAIVDARRPTPPAR